MNSAFVGLPAEDQSATSCSYGGVDITDVGCDRTASVHLSVVADGWGLVGLYACASHEANARASGTVVDEHRRQDACGNGDCWSSNQFNVNRSTEGDR